MTPESKKSVLHISAFLVHMFTSICYASAGGGHIASQSIFPSVGGRGQSARASLVGPFPVPIISGGGHFRYVAGTGSGGFRRAEAVLEGVQVIRGR